MKRRTGCRWQVFGATKGLRHPVHFRLYLVHRWFEPDTDALELP